MDGVHDLGGKTGYGEVDRSGENEVFHDLWEAKVFAIVGAAARAGAYANTDQFRHAIERIDPQAYLTHGYYGRWLGGLETLLVEAGLIDQHELTERAVSMGAASDDLIGARPKNTPDPMGVYSNLPTAARRIDSKPHFEIGDRVRTRAEATPGHTRLPEYARDKVGEVVMCHAGWVYPDSNAHGQGEQPQHLYTVEFTSQELWGETGFSNCIDLFEPYLSREKD